MMTTIKIPIIAIQSLSPDWIASAAGAERVLKGVRVISLISWLGKGVDVPWMFFAVGVLVNNCTEGAIAIIEKASRKKRTKMLVI